MIGDRIVQRMRLPNMELRFRSVLECRRMVNEDRGSLLIDFAVDSNKNKRNMYPRNAIELRRDLSDALQQFA